MYADKLKIPMDYAKVKLWLVSLLSEESETITIILFYFQALWK